MATIFDGYAKVPDSQIADQVVLLETITLSSVLKPYGQKAHRGAVRAVKAVGGLFGKGGDIKEPQVKELKEIVEENRRKLDSLSRAELDRRLRTVLRARAGALPGCTEEAFSAKVIDEAACQLKVDRDLTPAQKARAVYVRFEERLTVKIQKTLQTQTPEQVKETESDLDTTIGEMTEEQRRLLQETLKVDKLTGESVRNAMVKAGGPALLLGALTGAGFGAFVALSTVIHAIFTTILGITVPFGIYTGASSALAVITGPIGWLALLGLGSWQIVRGSKKIDQEMLAATVWFAVASYGARMTPPDEDLPSWVPQIEREQVEQRDQEYAALVAERNKAVREAEESAKRLKTLESQMQRTESSLESERLKRQKAEQSKADAESRLSELSSTRAAAESRVAELELELKESAGSADEVTGALSQNLNAAKADLSARVAEIEATAKKLEEQDKLVQYADQQISTLEKQIASIGEDNRRLESENERIRREKEKAEARAADTEEHRRKSIEDLWSINYHRFISRPSVLREAAKLKWSDRLNLERVLRELHDAKDPHTVSSNRGKLEANGNEHIRVDLWGAQWRVEYSIRKNEKQPIELIKLYPKSGHYMS